MSIRAKQRGHTRKSASSRQGGPAGLWGIARFQGPIHTLHGTHGLQNNDERQDMYYIKARGGGVGCMRPNSAGRAAESRIPAGNSAAAEGMAPSTAPHARCAHPTDQQARAHDREAASEGREGGRGADGGARGAWDGGDGRRTHGEGREDPVAAVGRRRDAGSRGGVDAEDDACVCERPREQGAQRGPCHGPTTTRASTDTARDAASGTAAPAQFPIFRPLRSLAESPLANNPTSRRFPRSPEYSSWQRSAMYL